MEVVIVATGLPADLAVVDVLARTQLALLRVGGSVVVDDASDALRDLIDLAGLGDILRVTAHPAR
jgi:hypothetical protein